MNSLLRIAGWSAVAAAASHLVQFLVLGIGSVLREPDLPTPAQSAANFWFGLAGSLTFSLIGLSYLVFFSAATALAWRDDSAAASVWRRAAHSAAVIGSTTWFLCGALNLARRGFNATAISASGAGDAVARAALQSTYVLLSAATITTATVFCSWWIAFAIRGARTQIFGPFTGVGMVVLGGAVPLAGWVANIGGIPSIILAFAVIGPDLLRSARRGSAARSAVSS